LHGKKDNGDEIGGTWSMHGRGKNRLQNSSIKFWKEEVTVEIRKWEENEQMHFKRNKIWGCVPNEPGSGYGPVAISCEHGNMPSYFIKCEGSFLCQ
jgi:hypothetical protein